MDGINELHNVVDTFMNRVVAFGEAVLAEYAPMLEDALETSLREYGAIEQETLSRIFTEAVQSFYDDYTPTRHTRHRSLFNLLDVKTDEYGQVLSHDSLFLDLYDRTKMTQGRKGNDLFQTVFVEGWHGGAKGIAPDLEPYWGAHPNPGIPHYRRRGWAIAPGSTKKRMYKYGRWGRRAEQAKTPIPEAVVAGFNAALAKELYDKEVEIITKHIDEAQKDIMKRVPHIARSFGFSVT